MDSDTMHPLAILFVEDEPDIRHVVEMALARQDTITLTTFATPFEALDHVRASTDRYDLVLLNYLLPGMSGADLAQRMKAFPATREARAVLITANVPPGGVAGYLADGAIDAVILKPFEITTLASRIRGIMRASDATEPVSLSADATRAIR